MRTEKAAATGDKVGGHEDRSIATRGDATYVRASWYPFCVRCSRGLVTVLSHVYGQQMPAVRQLLGEVVIRQPLADHGTLLAPRAALAAAVLRLDDADGSQGGLLL